MINLNKSKSYWISELKQRTRADFQLNTNGRWDVFGDVDLSDYGLCKIPIPLGNVTGYLNLSNNCYVKLCDNFPRNSSGRPGISFERCDFDGNIFLNIREIENEIRIRNDFDIDCLTDF